MKVVLIPQLEDLEPYTLSSDEVQQEMRWCWEKSFDVTLDDDSQMQLYVNNSCDSHQRSLMMWLYNGTVGQRVPSLLLFCTLGYETKTKSLLEIESKPEFR